MKMNAPLAIQSTTHRYLERHPEERARLAPLLKFLRETPPSEAAQRTNPVGHVTTSGFIFSAAGDALLLIYHLKLQRYLQPGGHVEDDASLLESALREIREEVGLSGAGIAFCQADDVPIDIDSHRIPADSRKNQPEHWHFDFRYLFRVTSDAAAALEVQVEEVARPEWCPWESDRVTSLLSAELIRRLRSGWSESSPHSCSIGLRDT